MGAKLDLLI